MTEEPQMPNCESPSKPIFKSKPPSSILNNNQVAKPSISATRYAEDEDECSILEKKSDTSQLAIKAGLKSIRYDNNPTTFDRSDTQIDNTNFDCTEIDFNLTQLNQTN